MEKSLVGAVKRSQGALNNNVEDLQSDINKFANFMAVEVLVRSQKKQKIDLKP